jgi:2-polyprenyl-3-methyl-5-hydroxy-6-metoxy-1,4-benzoquinol methylase
MTDTDSHSDDTTGEWYTERMKKMDSQESIAKRLHTVMYRRHIQNLATGRVLDVGCGIGMNLRFTHPESVGVDHNEHSVAETVAAGLRAYTPKELHSRADEYSGYFDSMLVAHVVEHMDKESGVGLLEEYLPYLKPSARIVLITPDKGGYVTDPTHVRFVDFEASRELVESVGFSVKKSYAFPIPRAIGKSRRGNEFVVVGSRAGSAG